MENQSKRIKVGIMFGGKSSEYEVSLKSATSILDNIDREKFEVTMIGVSKQGGMYSYKGAVEDIKNDKWQQGEITPITISTNQEYKGIIELKEPYAVQQLDVIFPVMHGKNAEDGTMQGVLSISGIPYVGCKTTSSAICMDKALTKTVLDKYGIANAKWELITKRDMHLGGEQYSTSIYEMVEDKLGYPCFVKPANAGSSVGVSKVANKEQLMTAIKTAMSNDDKVLIETAVRGREIECAVLGDKNIRSSVLGEIKPKSEFYDYEAKYVDNTTEVEAPVKLEEGMSDKIRDMAVEIYKKLDCQGLARVDFFLTEQGEVLLNEINTLPGFTEISMYPQLMELTGVGYSELISELIQIALDRESE